jgi:hypothetical protein
MLLERAGDYLTYPYNRRSVMNNYSRETLRKGHFATANGPYGSHRGNSVMHAKRTTGPSAQQRLSIVHGEHLAKEHAWLDSLPGISPKQQRTGFDTDPLGRRSMFGN